MGNFIFDNTIPAASHNPSTDQPIMLANNVSDDSIWAIDHIGYNANNGGTHTQITFINIPSVPSVSSTQSAIFPKVGSVDSTSANPWAINSAGSYNLNLIKAVGSFLVVNTNGAISFVSNTNMNCVSVVSSGGTPGSTYTIVLSSAVKTGGPSLVFLTCSARSSLSYTITGLTLVITVVSSLTVGSTINFMVVQL